MNIHDKKTEAIVSHESDRVETDHKNMQVLRSDLVDVNKLGIADDIDTGGDPYNSTGQHVVIESQLDIEE